MGRLKDVYDGTGNLFIPSPGIVERICDSLGRGLVQLVLSHRGGRQTNLILLSQSENLKTRQYTTNSRYKGGV